MNTKEKIEVMQAYVDGQDIECKPFPKSDWVPMEKCIPPDPIWDWEGCKYRIKPKPEILEDRIKAKWPDYQVVMLEFENDLLKLGSGCYVGLLHTNAQSMKGFAGYVYYAECKNPEMHRDEKPICQACSQPVAVLFSKADK